MTDTRKPTLNLTIGVEYINKGKSDTIKLGNDFRPRGQVTSLERQPFTGTMFQSTGVPMSSQPVIKQTTTVGSGSFGIQTIEDASMDMSTLATCENPNYSAGIDALDSGNGYMFMQNLEFRQGNVVHWGVEASGVSTTIDKITYDNFAAIGMMNPGEQAAFRLSPTGPKIKFVSASGEAAIAESDPIKQSRNSRLSYTIFPR